MDKHYFTNDYLPKMHRIGKITGILGVFASFLPALVLGFGHGLWPDLALLATCFITVTTSFGFLWVIEPISYYPVLGPVGTYMAFLSGNISNMRVPCASIAQVSAGVELGSEQGSIISTIGMGVSIIINIIILSVGVIAGSSILAMLPPSVTAALNYLLPALFGALFVQFAMNQKKLAVIMLVFGCVVYIAINKGVFNFLPGASSYLDKIPEKLIEIYDRNSIPLITMPYSPSWMTVVNQVNVGVLNHAIQSLRIDISQGPGCYNQNYKEQAIQKILKTLETEMEFPAFLYDVTMDKRYYSSDNFKKASEKYGIRESDYWSPQLPHTSHALCDCIHMKRYRLLKGEAANEPRISWVTIPIESAGVVQAYFCVMESRKFLDFYDEYSMRIAYLMLQGIFDQQVVARDASNIGFENLIHLAMESTPADARQLIYQANQLGLSVEQPYLCILFRHDQDELEAFKRCRMNRIGRVAFLSSTEGVILLNAVRLSPVNKEEIRGLILEFQKLLRGTFPDVSWFFSFTGDSGDLHDLRPHIEKCRKVLNIGRLTDSRKTIFDYDALGILTWINIPEDELGPLLKKLQKLIDSEKNQELLYTLKTYLENNLNYSLTAEKLFVNVNTVRRRIEKVNELIPVHWDDYVERTKLGLLLQYLQPGPDSIIHLKERRNGS